MIHSKQVSHEEDEEDLIRVKVKTTIFESWRILPLFRLYASDFRSLFLMQIDPPEFSLADSRSLKTNITIVQC